MSTRCSIFLLITGVVLLIGGLFAFAPQALEPSQLLTRLPPAAAPWLFGGGSLLAVLGLLGLLGALPRPQHPQDPQHAH